MTAHDIERRIVHERFARSIVMPHFTPPKWFECDVCEIKWSRGDFVADAAKRHDAVRYRDGKWLDVPEVQPTKHELLRAGDVHGPVRFYFVTPERLLTCADIPQWAGWIVAHDSGRPKSIWNVRLEVAMVAPKLHRTKADARCIDWIKEACYWRFHRRAVKTKEAYA